MFDYQLSTALVTGATSGIGEAIARALVARGVPTIVLVARDADALATIAADLRQQGPRVETVALDLTAPDAAAQVRAATDKLDLQVDLLVNDAGTVSIGSFDQPQLLPESSSSASDIVALNVAAVVGLTEQYLPAMVERRRGGVLNLGSTAGFQPVPYSAVYAASKAFIHSFSQALWVELQDRGYTQVRMVCICPGVTDTNLGFGHGEDRGPLNKVSVSTPAEIGQAALKALDDNAYYRVIGAANIVQTRLIKLLPSALVAGALARIRHQVVLKATGEPALAAAPVPASLWRSAVPLAGVLLVGAGLWRALRR